jgi:hypothetical protein
MPSGGVTQASSPLGGLPFGTGQIFCTSTTDQWNTQWSIKGSNLWRDLHTSGNPGQFNVNNYTVTFKANPGCTPPADTSVTVSNGTRATLTIKYT